MIANREYINAMKENTRLPFPYLIQLEITNECPFSCPQCYKNESEVKHMDFQKFKKFVSYCHEKGSRFFVLNGGEPMLYYKIAELLRFMNKIDVCMNCFTSGYGVTDEIMKLWNFDKHKLCLSLNGSTKEINGRTRQGYDITLETMGRLSSLKKNYGVNWVAWHDNLIDFTDLIRLCETYHVGYLFVTSGKMTGKGNVISQLNRDDYFWLAEKIRNYTGNVKIIVEACFSTLNVLVDNGIKKNYFMGCFAGKYGCHVDMDFNFSPCTHLDYYEKYDTLEEYWTHSEILAKLNMSNVDSQCFSCVYHSGCSFCKAWNREVYQTFTLDYHSCPVYTERRGR